MPCLSLAKGVYFLFFVLTSIKEVVTPRFLKKEWRTNEQEVERKNKRELAAALLLSKLSDIKGSYSAPESRLNLQIPPISLARRATPPGGQR